MSGTYRYDHWPRRMKNRQPNSNVGTAVRITVTCLLVLSVGLLGTLPGTLSETRAQGRPAERGTIHVLRHAAATPGLPDFNRRVLLYAASYQPQSLGGYAWPAPRGTHGTTRDLYLGDHRIARGSTRGNHCVGITFEVFWRALADSPGGLPGAGLSPATARRMLRIWFVPGDHRGKGAARALPEFELGRVVDMESALPGDFVQMWMNGGRGHSVIFLSWLRDGDRITGIRYWSSQPWTDGIDISEHRIGDGPDEVDASAIFLARGVAKKPARTPGS